MKKKIKIKKNVLPVIYVSLIALLVGATFITYSSLNVAEEPEEINYVSNSILSNDTPVVSTDKDIKKDEKTIIKPYSNEKIKIGKYYYDYKADASNQQNSIIYYENSYIQNSGVDYILDEKFDIVSIYDGSVIKVEENELVGKTIEIKHDNNLISVYQGLSDIKLKQGDTVKQGDIIGKSGTSKINKEFGNHLHFEIYFNGQVINPEDTYGKTLDKITG